MNRYRIAESRDRAQPAVSPRVSPEPARRPGQRGVGSPDGLWYRTVARYRSFGEAEQAADHLRDKGFPETGVTIVARDLRGLENATRRLVGWRAAGRMALVASAVGALAGWLIGLTGSSAGYVVLAGAWIGALFGAAVGFARHRVVTAGLDFTEVGGVAAGTYQVQVDRRHAQAERLLAQYWPT